jgi:hypothetical protein
LRRELVVRTSARYQIAYRRFLKLFNYPASNLPAGFLFSFCRPAYTLVFVGLHTPSTLVENGHNRSLALQHERDRALYVGWPTGNTPTRSPVAISLGP